MDNPNNQNNQYSQFPQSGVPQHSQSSQYQQNAQYQQYAQPTQTQTVSKGELFVGMNILSKIGVIFILIGVIAFSAVSEDYLPAWARMGLVLALGVIMLICGDLFRRKNSPIFANALTYGAVAELFIATLIGRFGFEVWNGTVAQVIGLVVAALGILLSLRYKSQPLLIVTQIFATLPAFACDRNAASVAVCAVCLMAVHAAVAIISRRKDYTGAYITGICLAFVHSCIIAVQAERIGHLDIALNDQTFVYSTFVIVFALCVAVCYAGGVLLNAAESDGTMFAWEITGTILSLASTALVIHFVLVRKRAEYNLTLAQYDFAPAATLEDTEIEAILEKADALTAWAADVKDYALSQALSPIAVVSKSDSVVTITITDKNGTTTASITEGASVDLG